MKALTINDLKQAVELTGLNKPCQIKHDYSKPGFCPYCHEMWTTKEQIDLIKKHKDWC